GAGGQEAGGREHERVGRRAAEQVADVGERDGPVEVAAVGPGDVPGVAGVGAGQGVDAQAAVDGRDAAARRHVEQVGRVAADHVGNAGEVVGERATQTPASSSLAPP